MTITIPDEFLRAARMSEDEMAAELAVVMYRQAGVPLPQAAHVAGMSSHRFAHLLASRDIPVDPELFGAGRTVSAEASQ
jgi:predicted HTH domain antitoxin